MKKYIIIVISFRKYWKILQKIKKSKLKNQNIELINVHKKLIKEMKLFKNCKKKYKVQNKKWIKK